MSVTKHIVCHTCKERLWIGQNQVIYTGEPNTMEALASFLLEHESSYSYPHELAVVDEHQVSDDDLRCYRDIDR